jgi:hypothetical protein
VLVTGVQTCALPIYIDEFIKENGLGDTMEKSQFYNLIKDNEKTIYFKITLDGMNYARLIDKIKLDSKDDHIKSQLKINVDFRTLANDPALANMITNNEITKIYKNKYLKYKAKYLALKNKF